LALPIGRAGQPRLHIADLNAAAIEGHPIRVAEHCHGCTAGQGSSCGGALGDGTAATPKGGA
ncbi:MAG TPA: DUF3641 domain-containing protein, partial [Accumulibacter sp.]|nr:DUF3641 domain-containing protein [Accumulibacter sp.]